VHNAKTKKGGKMKRQALKLAAVGILMAVPVSAQTARKDCEELKKEIAEKLDAKGVKNYELNIVGTADVKDEQVVGSCDGGSKKITYKRAK
jgi:hypothetical protein